MNTINTHPVRQTALPILSALIWGTSFVAQSVGADYLSPFSFNTIRSAIGFLSLLTVCAVLRLRRSRRGEPSPGGPAYRRALALGGLCCGLAMAVASNLQQKGLETTTSGKAGFITALYIVIVPVIGIFLKKRVPWTVWISVAAAVAGLYCLCIQEGVSVSRGDLYVLACSVCYAAQILLIDHFTAKVDGVELSCIQLLAVTVFSAVGMAAEAPALAAVQACLWPLLYTGILSSGVAYTLQILAQKDANPTVVSLLLSLESVFATVAGALILHDRMSQRELFGCALMFAAVLLAQLPPPRRRRVAQKQS